VKTVVLDDDPTGTQCATGVRVLLRWDLPSLLAELAAAPGVYLQTNSRAIAEPDAVALAGSLRSLISQAEQELGEPIQVVLRGDSTLRGHVVAESAAFAGPDAAVLFVPAFPEGGRTTTDGVHHVLIDGEPVPAAQTEYAADPVFGYRDSNLVDFLRSRGAATAVGVPLDSVRGTAGKAVADALVAAGPGGYVAPDVQTEGDVELLADAVRQATARGRRVVVRSGAPLAAVLAGVRSTGLLPTPIARPGNGVLVVCGSHTDGATRQLADLAAAHPGAASVVIGTDAAYADPAAEGDRAGESVLASLASGGLVVLSTERIRRAQDNTLEHGARVMTALMTATGAAAGTVDVIVSKGGITSAEVVRTALSATAARVRGQVVTGVSVWDRLTGAGDWPGAVVVVPGNVGDPSTLTRILTALPAA
jgi:uncharacterized protein YgbK (DUF1537 family)